MYSCHLFFFFERVTTYEIAHNHASLGAITVFESYDIHAVAAETLAPSVYTVFLGNTTANDELVIAAHTYIVIPGVTL